jgi:hypothetical protein
LQVLDFSGGVMSEVTIKIDGIDKLIAKLGKVQGVKILRPAMQRSVYRIQARLAQYPAQRPNSSYRRTGTLGRKWTSKIEEGNGAIRGRVGNNTDYAPLVQSKRFQARIHRGLWINTDEYVVETEQRNIERDFKQTIDEALR